MENNNKEKLKSCWNKDKSTTSNIQITRIFILLGDAKGIATWHCGKTRYYLDLERKKAIFI